jgi:NAD(P)-dependent dehydrogenase (short-subunit alcohol dehydrogenase family)
MTVVVTGSASGIGAATSARLGAAGHRVIGVDVRDADVVADLGTADGRRAAIADVTDLAGGSLDGVVTCAGVAGLTDRPGSLVASVNYFGTVALLEGLRPLLAHGDRPAAVAISSNSTTAQPGIPMDVVQRCLDDDEAAARAAADTASAVLAYPASKLAVAWWVRRHAPTAGWAGAGITLNAVAPGAVQTPMLEETRRDEVIGELVDAFTVPVGRAGTPDEVAAVIEFLLGPDARFFCGSVVFVDGGSDALLRPDDFPTPLT